ncbi:hypothetical protein [Ereboglobus luteus]|uniref:Tetratricopeptide repeat protein n=1 Tax=Ereboglobus luteus TaxID=1796921 RepID=A0A2U8E3A4_9BACT|nr:hypothetical protein [Ereboglobus luteus]AWI09265.1 hypothetical protein CKA38_08435 [Ereboglobus luteus]
MSINPLSLPGIIAEQIEICDDTEFAEARQTLADFERQCVAEPSVQNDEFLAGAHRQLLEAFDDYDAPFDAEPHLDALRRLHERHPANPRIIEDYANALAHHHDAWLTAEDADPARAAIPYQALLALAEKNPEHDLSEEIADAYFNQIHHYITRGEHRAADTIHGQLAAHHDRHPASAHITQRLAQAHLTRIYSCADTDELDSARAAYHTLEAFIQKHIDALPPPAQHNLRHMQIRALAHLVETSASPSNTGENPAPSDPTEIAAAETHYAAMRELCAPLADAEPRIARHFADAAIALCNHYNLSDEPAAAAEKYRDLERLADRYPQHCAPQFSRALYAQITSAIRERRFADAEKHHAAFERHAIAKRDAGAPEKHDDTEPVENLAQASAALANAYGSASRMPDAERHTRKIADLLDTAKRNPDTGASTLANLAALHALTLHNLIVDYVNTGDTATAAARHADLAALAAQHPDSAAAVENLADATDQIATNLAKNSGIAAVEKFLSQHVPETLASNPAYSKTLYNLIVIASDAKDITAAERLYAVLRQLVQKNPPHTTAALRLAKAAYNLHYDHSDAGDFPRAETKYRDLVVLSRIHEGNPALENGNPIGLEIALRQSNAARNYAIDLKNKNAAHRIPALLADIRHLAARWTSPAAKPVHDALAQITTLCPPQPPPLPGA